ncbi:DNA polymerase Y family protein [Streptomyces parvus]|uniref:DNA polymerase Y family protein n=1 Tax=Streptomyces parvus TaxID=66428 RepID=UPI002101BA69|nr:hypothetical protein [Streptomyces parvus]MCQ1579252.1 hypothetical protein [Streptomyces parvus]
MKQPVFFHVRLHRPDGLTELLEVLGRFTPVAQALPPAAVIGQMAGALRLFNIGPAELALRVRIQAIALHGLETMAGIGPSWSVAAMASARAGAKGLLSVAPEEVDSFLGPLPVEDLYGIHRAQASQLRRLGVDTIGQLADLPTPTVMRILGRPGLAVRERAQGIDRRTVVPAQAVQSTSVRADFPSDVLDGAELRATVLRLAAEVAMRLRSRDQAARTVTVSLRTADRRDLVKTRTLSAASAHTDDLRQAVYTILDGFELQRARIRRISVAAEAVDSAQAPMQLTFDPVREARVRVEPVLDALNQRYGPGTIGPAAAIAAA